MKRLWDDARAKVREEGKCRVCGTHFRLECAHITARRHDAPASPDSNVRYVHPLSVVPLCQDCHRSYDAHEIDLLGHLTPHEEARAVVAMNGLENARMRLCPSAYPKVAA